MNLTYSETINLLIKSTILNFPTELDKLDFVGAIHDVIKTLNFPKSLQVVRLVIDCERQSILEFFEKRLNSRQQYDYMNDTRVTLFDSMCSNISNFLQKY